MPKRIISKSISLNFSEKAFEFFSLFAFGEEFKCIVSKIVFISFHDMWFLKPVSERLFNLC